MSFDDSKIPIWLRRTPEQQAADQLYQDRLRLARGPGRRPSRADARLIRAAAVKLSATAQLDHLRTLDNPDPAQVAVAEAQLADALADEGSYVEAAELHPNPEAAERFLKIAEAIERDDDEKCDCPIERQPNPEPGKPDITIMPDNVTELVISKKHGSRLMPLVTCRCGDMNVKAAPAHLEERMRRTQEAHTQAKKETRQ